jgi:hypothetical protein
MQGIKERRIKVNRDLDSQALLRGKASSCALAYPTVREFSRSPTAHHTVEA